MQADDGTKALGMMERYSKVLKTPSMIKAIKSAVSLIFLFTIWELSCRFFEVPEYILPKPTEIIVLISERHEMLLKHSGVTFYETIAGFLWAVAFGVFCAAIIVMIPFLEDLIMPILLISQVVPKVAIAPIILIWFGFGIFPKILIAFLIAFFPIVVNAAHGLASVEAPMLDLARSLKATRWQIFIKFRIPTAIPHIFSGMKIAATLAVIGAVIGEFVGGSVGLGYLIIVANTELDTTLGFAALILLSAGGVLLYMAVEASERLFVPWSRSSEPNLPLGE